MPTPRLSKHKNVLNSEIIKNILNPECFIKFSHKNKQKKNEWWKFFICSNKSVNLDVFMAWGHGSIYVDQN